LLAEHGGPVDVVMITHRAREGSIDRALAAIGRESFQLRAARMLRIEDT